MAIDYSQYASSYAGQPWGHVLGQGIASAVEGGRERRKEEDLFTATKSYQESLNDLVMGEGGMGTNYMSMMDTNPADWEAISNPTSSAKTYLKWKNNLTPKQLKQAQKAGLVDPIAFKALYDQQFGKIASTMAGKIMDYQKSSYMSDDEMKDWVNEKGLGNFLRQNIQDPSNPYYQSMRDMSIPDETWKDWGKRKGFTGPGSGYNKAALTAELGIPMASGAYLGKKTYEYGKTWKSGADLSTQQFDDLAKASKKAGFGSKTAGALDKKAFTKQTTSKSALTRAQNQFNKAEKAYTGKTFKKSKVAKSLQTKINTAKKSLGVAKSKVNKGTGTILKKAIAKHGHQKVIKMLGKKLGLRGAMGLIGKLGLGAVAPGVGTAVAGALLVSDIIAITSVLRELAE